MKNEKKKWIYRIHRRSSSSAAPIILQKGENQSTGSNKEAGT